jgi:hypothetical protein
MRRKIQQFGVARYDDGSRAGNGRLENRVVMGVRASHHLMLNRDNLGNPAYYADEILNCVLRNPKLLNEYSGHFVDKWPARDAFKVAPLECLIDKVASGTRMPHRCRNPNHCIENDEQRLE